ncbi:DNA mismatch repair endonuclease MutL, partial [Sedimentibacter sp.]|uniref:DNA mismatch repair endonuclease MutL n=1 Tax=Sedimentibacter sp. TaxID=1960295 RepID=UPI0028A89A8C
LFFNVPTRKKFLKSDASESCNINEIVVSLALSKENISFKYVNNGNVIFRTPKTNNFLNTISSLYERALYNSLLKVDYENNGIIITGYTTNLNYYRGNRKQQIVFVNSRVIKHKRINYFIEAAYNTLLPKNKYPACFLKIEINPSLVDVNVHPAKTEVRFQNEDNILNEVKRAVYSALNSNNIMKEIKKETIVHDYTNDMSKNNSLAIFEKNDSKINAKKDIFDYNNENYSNIKITEININNEKVNIFDEVIDKNKDTDILIENKNEVKADIKEEAIQENKLPELSVAGILMDTYIICENIEKTEMYMIDQHAAHERINYEKFLNQYNNKEILLQEMIVPEVINLSYDDYHTAMSNAEIFKDLGFFIENFGINAILINSIPSIFKNSNIRNIFYTILDSLKNTSNINLELDKIIKNACVKSVKAGDKLHLLEVKALLNDLSKAENPYTCPHGRPVIIKMTKYEIEKMFERIQN